MDFFERRKERKAIERKIKAKEGRRKVERHVRNQQKQLGQYWKLAKRAYRLGDRPTFEKIAKAIANMRLDINRWERLLVTFDLFQAQSDQAEASAEFMGAFEAMAQSMLVNANPADAARIMQNTARAMAWTEAMEDRLDDLMDMTDETLADVELEHQGELAEIMRSIASEAEETAEPGFEDQDLEAVMKQIDEALQRRLG